LLLAALVAVPAAVPRPATHLFDPGQFLSAAEQEKVSQSLDAYARESKHDVIIYIDRTADGQPAETRARQTFDRWRAEQPALDDGVAVFLFTDDRAAAVVAGLHLTSSFIPERAGTICRTLVDSIELNQHDAGMDSALVDVRHAIESPMPSQAAASAVKKESHGPVWDAIDRIPAWGFKVFGVFLLGLLLIWAVKHPRQALQGLGRMLVSVVVGAVFDSVGSTFGASGSSSGGGSSGGGGSFGGGGASGSW
jgi:uncharacterized protein